jgi:spore coat polysaccharide biosynthesis protein SpsF
MQKVAVIVQARLGSTRLPAKVLLPLPTGIMTLCGERFVPAATVLEEVVNRCIMIDGVDVVVAAIPDTPENDILVDILNRGQEERQEFDGDPPLKIVRGPEHDVLARYAKAAEAVKADVIMRITADCPLIDPQVCGDVLKLQQSTGADYVSNAWPSRHFPHGYDCEVFTMEVLERAYREMPPLYYDVPMPGGGLVGRDNPLGADREHAGCPWMQRQQDIRKAHLKAMEDRSHLRWTLDTLSDYVRIWNVMQQQMREAA